MPVHIATPVISGAELPGQSGRRHGNRTPALFKLPYSGMENGQLLIGEGIASDFSPGGVGIYWNRLVTPGMRIAPFVDLPGMEESLRITQS